MKFGGVTVTCDDAHTHLLPTCEGCLIIIGGRDELDKNYGYHEILLNLFPSFHLGHSVA